MEKKALFQNVDCVSFFVDDLDEGIDFYGNALGLSLLWRTAESCGLGMQQDITELVLVNAHNPQVDFKVESVIEALPKFLEAGGMLVYGPFDIEIGKCAVVADKWSNKYCILDMTKGKYLTDSSGNVIGIEDKE